MPTYRYECMNSEGEMRSGRIDASSEADANQELRMQGFFVTKIKKVADAAAAQPRAPVHVGRQSSGCSSAGAVLVLLVLVSIWAVEQMR